MSTPLHIALDRRHLKVPPRPALLFSFHHSTYTAMTAMLTLKGLAWICKLNKRALSVADSQPIKP